jgi:hypothetical protein
MTHVECRLTKSTIKEFTLLLMSTIGSCDATKCIPHLTVRFSAGGFQESRQLAMHSRACWKAKTRSSPEWHCADRITKAEFSRCSGMALPSSLRRLADIDRGPTVERSNEATMNDNRDRPAVKRRMKDQKTARSTRPGVQGADWKRANERLDEALRQTFPASDALSIIQTARGD